MTIVEISDRDRKMLELLAQGVSNRSIAESLGYREGTMRVYLHGLYRKIGVPNKTSAVIWYFDRLKAEGRTTDESRSPVAEPGREESFGDIALRSSPGDALGAMNMFLGPYGRMWEVALRLKGAAPDEKVDRRRRQSRLLWEALLKGDFAYGKKLHDEDAMARLFVDSSSDCVLLACLVRIGGYTRAADRVMAQLTRGKKGRLSISAKEIALLAALREALEGNAESGLASIYRLATENSVKPIPRHAAMASLYWTYLARKDRERALGAANALFAEAEAVRQQLQAMGERPLYRDASMPQPASLAGKTQTSRPVKVKGAKSRATVLA
ncbi:MAG: helix-turn-helix transcriptional regulator [Betaproteobacteria bacterium]|nr:helix-turn-helix transcriptional regulator [Betaproteobacteria bacterium]